MAKRSETGHLRKMPTHHANDDVVQYQMIIGDAQIDLNEQIGSQIEIAFSGTINCIACGRKTNKSFQQGYCFPCMRSLPECDMCIVRPELCHFHEGTCRDAAWGEQHCMQDHYLYLANTSGLKVGITRGPNIPSRWMDQGAVQALPIIRAGSRYQIGQLEKAFKQTLNDRTQWQRMLKGDPEPLELSVLADEVLNENAALLDGVGVEWQALADQTVRNFSYPVDTYPQTVKSLNLDKTPIISGLLMGIKGQYLLLDSGVINIRKFAGYEVTVSFS